MTELLLTPVVSEKALALVENVNTYAFNVPKNASKIAVAHAVEGRYKVKVVSVNTTTHKGKSVQTLAQRGRRRITGKRATTKKAYVTLKKGDSIALFEGAQ